MTPVRQAALVLQQAGAIEILRKGKAVPAEQVRGVIRLRQAPPRPLPGTRRRRCRPTRPVPKGRI
ncbi:DUF3253 domain-containing protein [Paeniroseomonas aquatica]|uniref:DUF3253 domain-containing protein n=1 Tax=Paeniroseomonas aquatica TaxID=373043 RepID=UPI0036125306